MAITYVPSPQNADGRPVESGGGGGTSYFNKVDTSYIGGDATGNARGTNTLDVQTIRDDVEQVASGLESVALGVYNTASGDYSAAIGWNNTASAYGAFALGVGSTASGYKSTASGYDCSASGAYSSASGYNTIAGGVGSTAIGISSSASGDYSTTIGAYSSARIEGTMTSTPQIIEHDRQTSPARMLLNLAGPEIIFTTTVVDLKVAADISIPLPAGSHFFPNECGVIVTESTGLTVQPTVRFGITGTEAKFLAATICTTAASLHDRQRFATLLSGAGETTLSAGVTVGATATSVSGRFYFKGMFLEDPFVPE